MMPLVDRPFVAHQLDLLRRHGVRDVVFSCGYRPDALRGPLRRRLGRAACGCATSSTRSRSARPARSKNAEDLLDDAPFLVLNGDILTDLDLGAVVRAHARAGAAGRRSR